MSNVCEVGLPNGINLDCLVVPGAVKSFIITDKNVTFADVLAFESKPGWKTKVQTDLSVWVNGGHYNYDLTTNDPIINETGMGIKLYVRGGTPSATVYLNTNTCDFREMLGNLTGGTYGVFFVLEDNSIQGWMDDDTGVVYPYTANINADTKGFQPIDAIENAFPVYFNFLMKEEFTASIYRKPTWNPNLVLAKAMPLGLSLSLNTAYAGGLVVVNVTERCKTAGLTGLVLADFEFIAAESRTSASPITIDSVTDNTDGTYDVTISAGGAATPLVSGDIVAIRVNKIVSGITTQLSNKYKVNA